MSRIVILGAALIGGALALQSFSAEPRRRLGPALSRRMLMHMEQMLSSLPDSAPPKLVMSVLPRLREQNDQIIAMLQEQNALLREHLQKPH